jgi:hypothetical protein
MSLTFEHDGVTIRLRRATMRARLYLNDLRSMVGYWDMPDEESKDVGVALQLLYLVESVEGSWGYDIPTQATATPENVKAFCDNILDAHEALYLKWSVALASARSATQADIDLLPKEEISDSQKKIKAS